MNQELLHRYNPFWDMASYPLEGVIQRAAAHELMKKHLHSRWIIFITGLRRVGKTTLFKLLIQYLIEQESVDPRHICYLSLDDYQLSHYSILELVEEYRKIHKLKFVEKIFLFLDEIAYKKDFEIQCKNIYDNQNVKIFASSSSSSILKSKKIFLTGRNVVFELLPLDFREYLSFKNIIIAKADAHLVDSYFEDYLQTGGIPEYVMRNDIEYIKELIDDIIYKDIAGVYGIRNPHLLKEYFLLLMERAGKVASINKIARILTISPDTAKRFFDMFCNVYLIYPVSRWGKTNVQLRSAKKIYAADLGIRTYSTGFRDKGSLFENYVYHKIKHMNLCYIYENGIEIDFIVDKKTIIEVKYQNEMAGKQKLYFEQMPTANKIVLHGIQELEAFLEKNKDVAQAKTER